MQLPAFPLPLLGFVLTVLLSATAGFAAPNEPLTGVLLFEWGDPAAESEAAPVERVLLGQEDGHHLELDIAPELLIGGSLEWHGLEVKVYPSPPTKTGVDAAGKGLRVAAVEKTATQKAAPRKMITGSQPWISIPCKFSDVADEPENQSFFQNMYDNSSGRLDHYWREVSFQQINVLGSTALGWLVLPNPRSHYVTTQMVDGQEVQVADLDAIFDDCTAAADPFIDFAAGGSGFVGINMMFNDVLDCCAWGGGRYATLDGLTKLWRVTWNPPWAFANQGVIAHEMGHGFGLPHANNSDGDSNPYDSPWDVMSSATGRAAYDATYGALGKHVNAYHKDRLGWIPAARLLDVERNTSQTVTIDQTAIATTGNYRMAKIALPDSGLYYTIEARKRVSTYEGALAGEGIIIHKVDPTRREPSWLIDGDNPPADYSSNAGSVWTVGETFNDAADAVTVEVVSETPDGFTVRIVSGNADDIFMDGFESGDLLRWSESSP